MQQIIHRLVALILIAKDNVNKVGDGDAGKRIGLDDVVRRKTVVGHCQPFLALSLRQLLDGIAQHGAWHLVGVLTEEVAKQVEMALAHLA